jgi:hypothetical protein
MACQAHNKQLQRTVRHKVPRHIGQRAAAELRRYAARIGCRSRKRDTAFEGNAGNPRW